MNILFISVLVEEVTKKTEDYRKEHGALREEIASATSPSGKSPAFPLWPPAESNEVYVAAVKVGEAIASAHGQPKTFTGMHDCVMRILGAARAFAFESGLDHRQIIAGLADVATLVERAKVEQPFDSSEEGWWRPYTRWASILLTVVCRVYEAQLADEHMRSMLAESSPRKERLGNGVRVKSAKECADEFLKKWEAKRANKGPVMLFDDRVVFECHPENPGPIWAVPLAEIQNPSRLLKWVSDLTSKTWCTAEMVRDFVGMVCSEKGWEIYNFDSTLNQETQA